MRASNDVSDLSQRHLPRLLKSLIVGAFLAAWKPDDDVDNCGLKVFGFDENCPFEYVVEYLDYMSCLFLSCTQLETGQEWPKDDIHPVMQTYRESGKSLIIRVLIVFNIRVIIVNKGMMLFCVL